MKDDFKSFDDFLTWAVWYVIEGITKGDSLHSRMHFVVSNACAWNMRQSKKVTHE